MYNCTASNSSGVRDFAEFRQKRTLIINGQSMEVPHWNGHAYVGFEALAAALKGSLSSYGKLSSFGKMVALSIPFG
jgi:hypothetical protein